MALKKANFPLLWQEVRVYELGRPTLLTGEVGIVALRRWHAGWPNEQPVVVVYPQWNQGVSANIMLSPEDVDWADFPLTEKEKLAASMEAGSPRCFNPDYPK